jgi:class 3 adenylate cyclase
VFVVTPLLAAALFAIVAVLVAGALGIGYAVGSRSASRQPHISTSAKPVAGSDGRPASLGALVTRTGSELATIAVRTGLDLGNRAIRDSLGALSTWAQQERLDLRRVTAEDGTVTLMFTDIEGSTALNERLGDERWLEVLAAHDHLLRRLVRSGGGRVIKTQGDSFMVAFADAVRAVACAVAIEQGLVSLDSGADADLRVRIGMHTGPALARGDDLFGLSVATAARVAAEAAGGEILVTKQLAERLGDRELGRPRRLTLRGITGTQVVRSVPWEPGDAPAKEPVRRRRRLRR